MSLHAYEIEVRCKIRGIEPAKRINCVKFMLIEIDKDGDCLRQSIFHRKASFHITVYVSSGSQRAKTVIWIFQLHVSQLYSEHVVWTLVLLPLGEFQARNDIIVELLNMSDWTPWLLWVSNWLKEWNLKLEGSFAGALYMKLLVIFSWIYRQEL